MKKWMIIYLTVLVILFAGGTKLQYDQMVKAGEFTEVCAGENQFCQGTYLYGRTDIIIWGEGHDKAVRIDKRLDEFELLDMAIVDDQEVYYQFQFRNDEGKEQYGLGKIDLKRNKAEILETWDRPVGIWVAFGYSKDTNQIVYETTSENAVGYSEYSKTLPWTEGEWKKVARTSDVAAIQPKLSDGETQIFKRAELEWKFICMKKAVSSTIIAILLIGILVGLILNGIFGNNSTILRLFSILQLFILVVMVLLMGVSSYNTIDQALQQQALTIASNTGYMLSQIPSGNEVTSGALEELRMMNEGVVSDVATVSIVDDKMQCHIVVPDDSDTFMSKKLNSSAVDIIRTAQEEMSSANGWVSYKDRSTIGVAICDLYHAHSGKSILAIIEPSYVEDEIEECVANVAKLLVPTYLIIAIALLIVEILYELRWRAFVTTSKSILLNADSKNDLSESDKRFKSFGILWKLVLQMEHMVKESNYQMQKGIRFGYRFVPDGLDRLFGIEKSSDLKIGDQITKTGSMVWFNIGSIKRLDNEAYMSELSDLFATVKSAQEENNGVWIHYDSEFSKNRIFFEQGNALQFATRVIDHIENDPTFMNVPKLMLVHNDNYHFGIAGTEDKAFSYAYSAMDDCLDEFFDDLSAVGVRVAVTQAVYQANKNMFKLRYIGFVVCERSKNRIELYECIDAYETERRAMYLQTAGIFEQALDFFYSKDFYLSRNLFNEVIQMNPTDEIARLYLFKCENFLNSDNNDLFSYGLFDD